MDGLSEKSKLALLQPRQDMRPDAEVVLGPKPEGRVDGVLVVRFFATVGSEHDPDGLACLLVAGPVRLLATGAAVTGAKAVLACLELTRPTSGARRVRRSQGLRQCDGGDAPAHRVPATKTHGDPSASASSSVMFPPLPRSAPGKLDASPRIKRQA